MGITIGYFIYFFIITDSRIFLEEVKVFPFATAILTSLITVIIMTIVKKVYQRYKFEHFYLMGFGQLCFVVGGALFVNHSCKYF